MAKYIDSKTELKRVIEKELVAKIPNEVWDFVIAERHPPFDKEDKQEFIDILAEHDIVKIIEEDANPRSFIRSKIYAQRVLPEVEGIRRELFGSKEPPFPNNLIAAGDWLETEAKNQPAPEGHAPRWGYKLSPGEMKKLTVKKMKKLQLERPGKYGLEFATLGYSRGDEWAHYVIVSDGTRIRRLWLDANTIAKKLGCQDYQATDFILTGSLPYVPSMYIKKSGSLDGIGIYARAKIELILYEPVTEEKLIQEYRIIRKKIWGKVKSSRKISHRNEQLIYFSEENIDFETPSWEKNRRKWNNKFPNYWYKYPRTFRTAILRAYKRIFPEADPKSIIS